MSSLTSLLKHGGSGHSGSYDKARVASEVSRRSAIARSLTAFLLAILLCSSAKAPAGSEVSSFVPSKAASEECTSKIKSLEDFANRRQNGQTQTTKFSENEINSYLALDLQPKYHASLKSLLISFKESKLQANAAIDFDHLGTTSTKFLPKLLSLMFSGTHAITADGQLMAKDGKGNFLLEQALFDSNTLPKYLVEEIISAVGRKQNPPFDPLKPSKMPYEINRVEVHPGYIIVFQ